MKIEIKNRWTDVVMFSHECETIKQAVLAAVAQKVDLSGAYLSGADLSGAYLSGAYLSGAYLSGAVIYEGIKLVGKRPVLQVGPLGSRQDYLVGFITDAGIRIKAGCFFGTLEQFEEKTTQTHGTNEHGREYLMACILIRAHYELWKAA